MTERPTEGCTWKRCSKEGPFRATEEGIWLTHEDVNPVTGEVYNMHFWLVEHGGLVFGSGWRHDDSGS